MYGYTSKWKIVYMCRHMVGAKAMWTYLYRAVDSTGATINFCFPRLAILLVLGASFRRHLPRPASSPTRD
jgi:hypothetical protein